jgi:hypothetical protein
MAGQKTISCTYNPPLIGPNPPLFESNFENYINGNLDGQWGWVASTNFQIQNALAYSGTKCVKAKGVRLQQANIYLPQVADGLQSCMVRKEVAKGGPDSISGFTIVDSAARTIGRCGLECTYFYYYSNGLLVWWILSYNLSQWYKLDIQWRSTPDKKVRYRCNNGTWTDWLIRGTATSVDPAARLRLTNDEDDVNTEFYWDLFE